MKLLDQLREVLRLKHYSIRNERCYCDWIPRYIKFHHILLREELTPGESKIELFLSDLAVNGQEDLDGAGEPHHRRLLA